MAVLVMTVAFGAGAQEISSPGGRVFGLVGGSFGDGGTTVVTSGGAGLRLTRHLGVDFELLYVPGMEPDDDDFTLQIGRLPGLGQALLPNFDIDRDGSITTFLTKLTVDFPVAGDRLVPYVTGGGGVGRLRETTTVNIRPPRFPSVISNRPGGLLDARPLIFPPQPFDRSETGLALTIGGGVDFMLWRGLGVGADVRWMRLLVSRDNVDVANVAARVSYRF